MGAHPRSYYESVATALESDDDDSATLNGKLANLRSKLQKARGASDGKTGSQNRRLGDGNGVAVKKGENLPVIEDSGSPESMNEDGNATKGPPTGNGVTVKKKNKEENENVDSGSSESRNEDGNSSKGPPTCPECGKTFPSLKALYGHLRCHPQRGYRGAHRPPEAKNSSLQHSPEVINAALILMQISRDTRNVYPGSMPSPPQETTNRSQDKKRKGILDDTIVEMDPQLIDAMHSENREGIEDECSDAMEASNNGSQSVLERKLKKKKKKKNKKIRALESVSEATTQTQPGRGGRYRCSTCSKSFATHQALGGHKASHNKSKSNAEQAVAEDGELADGEELVDSNGVAPGAATGEHRCTLCPATFPTGQALGGHKRKHWNGPVHHPTPPSPWAASPPPAPSSSKSSVEKANGGLLGFDLNKLPETEEP